MEPRHEGAVNVSWACSPLTCDRAGRPAAVGRRPLFLPLDLAMGLPQCPHNMAAGFLPRAPAESKTSYSIVHEPASGVTCHCLSVPSGLCTPALLTEEGERRWGLLETLLEAGNHSPCLQNAHLNVLSNVHFPLFNVILPVLHTYT